MTLPRRCRLSGSKAFSDVFRNAVVSADACFKVLGHDSGESRARLGMAVSRQIDRRAVGRNRLKRIIRESFRSHYLSGTERRPVDVVVLPRAQAAKATNKRLFELLSRHWCRIDERVSEDG